MTQQVIAANWKMNGSPAMARELVPAISSFAASCASKATIIICPPDVLVTEVAALAQGSFLAVGGQNCSQHGHGAYTGEVSAAMLSEVGCRYVILGHSERRQYHQEGDALVAAKAKAAMEAGLVPIICVGEQEEERRSGQALAVVAGQVKGSIPQKGQFLLAYEPVWAIGSGKLPTSAEIGEMHQHLRAMLPDIPLLYGGSVKAANAGEILTINAVDGVLVGGASLNADEFCGIIAAAEG